jgi:hypothetical protein
MSMRGTKSVKLDDNEENSDEEIQDDSDTLRTVIIDGVDFEFSKKASTVSSILETVATLMVNVNSTLHIGKLSHLKALKTELLGRSRSNLSSEQLLIFNDMFIKIAAWLDRNPNASVDQLKDIRNICAAFLSKGFSDSGQFVACALYNFNAQGEFIPPNRFGVSISSDKVASCIAGVINGIAFAGRKTSNYEDALVFIVDKQITDFFYMKREQLTREIFTIIEPMIKPQYSQNQTHNEFIKDYLKTTFESIDTYKKKLQNFLNPRMILPPEEIINSKLDQLYGRYKNLLTNAGNKSIALEEYQNISRQLGVLNMIAGIIKDNFDIFKRQRELPPRDGYDLNIPQEYITLLQMTYPRLTSLSSVDIQLRGLQMAAFDSMFAHDFNIDDMKILMSKILPGLFPDGGASGDTGPSWTEIIRSDLMGDNPAIQYLCQKYGLNTCVLNTDDGILRFGRENYLTCSQDQLIPIVRDSPCFTMLTLNPNINQLELFVDFTNLSKFPHIQERNRQISDIQKYINAYIKNQNRINSRVDDELCCEFVIQRLLVRVQDAVTVYTMFDSANAPTTGGQLVDIEENIAAGRLSILTRPRSGIFSNPIHKNDPLKKTIKKYFNLIFTKPQIPKQYELQGTPQSIPPQPPLKRGSSTPLPQAATQSRSALRRAASGEVEEVSSQIKRKVSSLLQPATTFDELRTDQAVWLRQIHAQIIRDIQTPTGAISVPLIRSFFKKIYDEILPPKKSGKIGTDTNKIDGWSMPLGQNIREIIGYLESLKQKSRECAPVPKDPDEVIDPAQLFISLFQIICDIFIQNNGKPNLKITEFFARCSDLAPQTLEISKELERSRLDNLNIEEKNNEVATTTIHSIFDKTTRKYNLDSVPTMVEDLIQICGNRKVQCNITPDVYVDSIYDLNLLIQDFEDPGPDDPNNWESFVSYWCHFISTRPTTIRYPLYRQYGIFDNANRRGVVLCTLLFNIFRNSSIAATANASGFNVPGSQQKSNYSPPRDSSLVASPIILNGLSDSSSGSSIGSPGSDDYYTATEKMNDSDVDGGSNLKSKSRQTKGRKIRGKKQTKGRKKIIVRQKSKKNYIKKSKTRHKN